MNYILFSSIVIFEDTKYQNNFNFSTYVLKILVAGKGCEKFAYHRCEN